MTRSVDPAWTVTVTQGIVSQHVPVETIREVVQVMTASGPVHEETTCLILDSSAAAIVATIAAPRLGWRLTVHQLDSGTEGHTLALDSGTYDGSSDTATLDAAGEGLELIGVSDSRFAVLANRGGVSIT